MDRYEEMLEMYEKNPRFKANGDKEVYLKLLKDLDEKNQLFEVREEGKLRGFTAWVYTSQEEFREYTQGKLKVFTNIGKYIFPVFIATDGKVPISLMKKIGEVFKKKGPLLIYRKGRGLQLTGGKIWA